MAWSSKTNATQLTSITVEQFFNQTPTLDPGEIAHVQISVDFPTTPTDHAVISVYSTLDDSSEVWDLVPFLQFQLDKATDPSRASFYVSNIYKFRIGVKRSGSTDTLTSADMSYRTNGVAL